MEDAGTDDLIEGRAELGGALERELANVEVPDVVLSFQRLGEADTRGADVDSRHARLRPAQGVLGSLGRAAARDQDGGIFTIRARGPEEMMVRAPSLSIVPATAVALQIVGGR